MPPPDGAREPEVGLGRLQRWMQAVVAHPGCVHDALASDEAAAELPAERISELVRPSRSLTPEERVEVYHGMYLLRMVEALESDYPAIRAYLGEEGFTDLVRDYVARHPSRSYTLNRLGDHLPEFVLQDPAAAGRSDAAILHDLARAELAVTQAFDAEETAVLSEASVQGVAPEAWSDARLRPVASLRLLELKHAVSASLDAVKRGLPAPVPRRRASWLVFWRRDYTVVRLELVREEHRMLASLLGGTTIGEAVEAAAQRLRASERQDTIYRWFRKWIAEGLFAAVEFPQR